MIYESSITSLDYDDVLLIPRPSTILSRDGVKIEYGRIFSSPMKGLEKELLVKLDELGIVGILHRFHNSRAERINAIKHLAANTSVYGVALGLEDVEDESFIQLLLELECNYFVLDVANGYLASVVNTTYVLSKLVGENGAIISGNVADPVGFSNLKECGAHAVRVGIGGGEACITRNVTGCGVPDLSAIKSCAVLGDGIIADGGIKDSGRAVKAFAFGADHIMIGGLLSRAMEADNNGIYYGMSSARLQKEMGKKIKSSEGIEKDISKEKRPLEEIVNEFLYGIKSGLSYLGCRSIDELHKANIEYIRTGKNTLKITP
jgi:IMP dehydrogenase